MNNPINVISESGVSLSIDFNKVIAYSGDDHYTRFVMEDGSEMSYKVPFSDFHDARRAATEEPVKEMNETPPLVFDRLFVSREYDPYTNASFLCYNRGGHKTRVRFNGEAIPEWAVDMLKSLVLNNRAND